MAKTQSTSYGRPGFILAAAIGFLFGSFVCLLANFPNTLVEVVEEASFLMPDALSPSAIVADTPRIDAKKIAIKEETCRHLFDEVRAGKVVDPNGNSTLPETAMYKRHTTTDPPFWISLHNHSIDHVRWAIMKYGFYYEDFITENHKTVLEQGGDKNPIYIDVGMNIGWFSLWALALGATTYSFEPNPINRLRYCESLLLNQVFTQRSHLYAAGVGAATANMTLSYGGNNPGAATFGPHNKGEFRVDNVPIVTLDAVAEQEKWLEKDSPPVHLLKIDVEGLEPPVLFGATKLIASQKVLNIFLEYSCNWSSERDLKKITNQLVDAGYKLHNIGKWNGAEIEGAIDTVVHNVTGSFDERLFSYCMHWNGKQLNLWWKPAAASKAYG